MIKDRYAMRITNFDCNYKSLVLFINKLFDGNYALLLIIGRLFYGSYQFHISITAIKIEKHIARFVKKIPS
jgi:hypothetical protein